MFQEPESKKIDEIPSRAMKQKFSEDEVRKAIDSLKTNKNPGIDSICAEQLKYSSAVVYKRIVELLITLLRQGITQNRS